MVLLNLRPAHACRALNKRFFSWHPAAWNDLGHGLSIHLGRRDSRGPGFGPIGRADLVECNIFSSLGFSLRLGLGLGHWREIKILLRMLLLSARM